MPAACSASWAAANGSTTSAGPHRTISRAGSEASAWATPSSTTPGASSPPMASTATTTFSSDISKTSLSRIGQREALRYLILRQRRRGAAPTPSRKHASIRGRGNAQGQDQVHQSLAVSSGSTVRRTAECKKSLPAHRTRSAMCEEACQCAAAERARMSGTLLRLDNFAVLVEAAVRAHAMRKLDLAALRAHGTRGRRDLVVGAATGVGAARPILRLGTAMILYLLL